MAAAPEIASRVSGRPHLAWWGVNEAPFQLEPNPRFAYQRADHREALARLLFGVTQLGGIVTVTGEVGCGKTMLTHELARMLGGDGFRVIGVANPPRTPSGVLASLLAALQVESRGGAAARLASSLRARVQEEVADGTTPVIVIDEAQRLDARALDELRMLTNPGEGSAVPVVLLGQPELWPRIARQPQVAQRVVVRYHLGPMGAEEVTSYIQHRSRVAGATRRLFSQRAEELIHAETGGIPRLVNLMCANALFIGYVRGETQVGEDLIRDLAEDDPREPE